MLKTEHSLENLKVAKIVGTPTLISWSQAYNAGGFFALLSLTKEEEEIEEEDKLSHLGKSILNNLEAEYFSLEEKNLESIKQAISSSIKTIEEGFSLSLTVISIINNILYAFSLNGGKVFIKRQETLGPVLPGEKDGILSSSGLLENLDTIILETKQFNDVISMETLKESLDHFSPDETAESLSPKIHETKEGGAAAIFISYQEVKTEKAEEEEVIGIVEERKTIKQKLEVGKYLKYLNLKIPQLNLASSKKIFLGIGILLTLVLIFGVFFTLNKQEGAKTKALFEEIYPQALKKFDEGEALLDLNKNLAKEDLTEAKRILTEGEGKFKKGSKESDQIKELLAKIDSSITLSSEINTVQAKEVGSSESPLLSWVTKESSSFAAEDSNYIYFLNQDGVSQVAKNKDNPKVIIKKSWQEAGGLGVFLGNVYVLDKDEGQIYKFAASGFSKSDYLSSTTDFSKASSIAIDGAIYILQKDGTILKYLRGNKESFNVTGLDKPFSSPARIFTSREINNLYILDSGNQRIVVLDKNGAYQAQYQAGILKTAVDFQVKETDKKIFLLSASKIYQIDLK